jgi:uncharacterized protein YkvS
MTAMKKAEVGSLIEYSKRLPRSQDHRIVTVRGIVEIVKENSVIVDQTYMDNYRELDLEYKTVVNHKNYKIIKL